MNRPDLADHYELVFEKLLAWFEEHHPERLEVSTRDDTNKTLADIVIKTLEEWEPSVIDWEGTSFP